jgi:hypothetical protein
VNVAVLILFAALTLLCHVAGAQDTGAEHATVTWYADIQPILSRHCSECHNSEKQNGGLSLASRFGLDKGGDSTLPLTGGDLDSNELYHRLTTDDAARRMPFGRPRLGDPELDKIRTWIEQGCAWGEPATPPPPTGLAGWVQQPWAVAYLNRMAVAERVFPLYRFALLSTIGVLVVVFARSRARQRLRNRDASAPEISRWLHPLAAVHWRDLLLALFGVWLVAAVGSLIHNDRQSTTQVAALDNQINELTALHDFGDPPIPFRLPQPKTLHGVYYRGNNERLPHLFNGGVYQTAILSVDLVDADGTSVEYGDQVTALPMSVSFTIERSPHASLHLFTETQMSQVVLSNKPAFAIQDANQALLTTLEPGERWRAAYPLPRVHGKPERRLEGMIYVYYAGSANFGIRYTIVLDEDDRVVSESDVWMGNLSLIGGLVPRKEDRIPPSEWFDNRPLPVIPGPHANNPELNDDEPLRPLR